MRENINDQHLIHAATDPLNPFEALRQLADQFRRAYEYEKAAETYSQALFRNAPLATYTCVGDTVNLAARLEAHTRVAGQPVLIDATTRLALSGAILIEEQGWVQLKGKIQEVQVFSVPVGSGVSLP